MCAPQGLQVMLLCDGETGEMVDQVQCHIQLLRHLHVSLLLMTNNQAYTLFASVSVTITEVQLIDVFLWHDIRFELV